MVFLFIFTALILNGASGILQQDPVTDTSKVPEATKRTKSPWELLKKSLENVVEDEVPDEPAKVDISEKNGEDVALVANQVEIGRSDDRDSAGPTTPKISWVFVTVKTNELRKFLNSRENATEKGYNWSMVLNIIENLTSDYDNAKLLDKLDKALVGMDLPECKEDLALKQAPIPVSADFEEGNSPSKLSETPFAKQAAENKQPIMFLVALMPIALNLGSS